MCVKLPDSTWNFRANMLQDGSFTCTLFLPSAQTFALEKNPASIPEFFDKHFPGVTELIPGRELIESFERNPHLPLISVKCSPYHYKSSAVILGDAAHAMVPFYGQGMNAGLEDVRVLFSILDKHAEAESNSPLADDDDDAASASASAAAAYGRKVALAEYTTNRVPDAHAINDLALQNYVEMRASVLSPKYRLRKWLEEMMSVYLPGLGWQTKYSRVSFENQRYSEVVAQSEHQGEVLVSVFEALVCSPFIVGAVWLWWKQPKWIARTYQTWTEKAIMAAFERL